MTHCRGQKHIQNLLMGTLEDDHKGELFAHLEHCVSCRELYKTYSALDEDDSLLPEPRTADLQEMRRGALRTLRTRSEPRAAPWLRFWQAHPAWAVAALLVLTLGSGFLGRLSAPSANGGTVLDQLQRLAAENQQAHGGMDSRFRFSNVDWRRVDDSDVVLRFDVSTYLELNLPKDDPLTTEILVQTLRTASLDGRLKAVSHADSLLDPRVRQALIRTMHEDPSQAVRLEALEKLRKDRHPDVENALITVLAREESVQMRLLAVDSLAAGNVQLETLEQALTANPSPQSSAVEWRVRNYRSRL